MMKPAQKRPFFQWLRSIFHIPSVLFVIGFLVLFIHTQIPPVFAQTPTPTPPAIGVAPGPNPIWQYDVEVTEVGKNAERSRQLLYWVLSHPAIHSAPVIAKLWGISRNIVYVFIVLVMVAFGLGLILSRRAGSIGPIFSGISSPFLSVNVPSILLKIGMILLYVTFSYIFVLGLIQVAELSMRFIKGLAGEELFNVIFAGSGNIEDNYTTFVGFRDNNPNVLEMVRTSLTVIRFTSFTYNVMAVILILRTVILWFMLILSPFLALLMPFIFIRNTGYIWIGVFFQWLFYGPMVLLFLVSLTNIWSAGIPFAFEFQNRVNCTGAAVPRPECTKTGQVYRTAINILYGGPAQTLSAGNSSNYIDTYAEYVISLVMLWASIILPWFLLRIFRDYCCELIAAGNAQLSGILDRMRQFPTPSPPPTIAPTSTAGMAVELPFRQQVTKRISDVFRVTQQTKIEDIKNISNVTTDEITRKMDMSVSSLKDVSRFEMNETHRSQIEEELRKIAAPAQVSSSTQRERYSMLKNELTKRAMMGDQQAATILAAGEKKTSQLVEQAMQQQFSRPTVAPAMYTKMGARPGIPTTVPVSTSQVTSASVFASSLSQVAQSTNVSESKVHEIADLIPASGQVSSMHVSQIAQKTQVSDSKVQQVITQLQSAAKASISAPSISIPSISKQVNIEETKVKEVIQSLTTMGVVTQQSINSTAQKTNLPTEKVAAIVREARMPVSTKPVPTVTVEDYEEVKSMWLTHYRNAPVPVSGTIKDRSQWIEEEEKKLTNISHLLSSSDQKLKQQGLEKVADILPFMLLGNFSQTEIAAYIKAKLEADKQVKDELAMQEKIKKETIKEVKEEEETLLPVEQKTKKEEQKHMEAEKKEALPDQPKKPTT